MNRHRETTTGVAVLMYHRVCPRSAHTACYFARGTAITPEIFSAQMHYLAECADVVALGRLDEVRQAGAQTRPTVVLTFDDGYADIRTHVWPLCQKLGLPFSVFPIAGHTANSSVPCWVDWYYGLLHGARRRDSVILRGAGLGEPERAPGIDEDLRWWVRGPLKELLHRAEPKRRSQLLGELAELLKADIDTSALARELYLGIEDLRMLQVAGIEVGGHGVHHLRLRDCSDSQRRAEISGSAEFLAMLDGRPARWFCYPDGSHDDEVAAAVASTGFVGALTVQPGFVTEDTPTFMVPRFLVRNRPPEQPGWCGAASTAFGP